MLSHVHTHLFGVAFPLQRRFFFNMPWIDLIVLIAFETASKAVR